MEAGTLLEVYTSTLETGEADNNKASTDRSAVYWGKDTRADYSDDWETQGESPQEREC